MKSPFVYSLKGILGFPYFYAFFLLMKYDAKKPKMLEPSNNPKDNT